jgi:uncharacterized peroxidase-related enzyme
MAQIATFDKFFVPVSEAAAPEIARAALRHARQALGFVPNLLTTLANAPSAANGYVSLVGEFGKGTLTTQEQHIVMLAASVENESDYCIAIHSKVVKAKEKAPAEWIAAIRGGTQVPDPKLDALVNLTKEIVRERGYVHRETVDQFLAAGYQKEQVVEILLGVALKTISNYLNHISVVEPDMITRSEQVV